MDEALFEEGIGWVWTQKKVYQISEKKPRLFEEIYKQELKIKIIIPVK